MESASSSTCSFVPRWQDAAAAATHLLFIERNGRIMRRLQHACILQQHFSALQLLLLGQVAHLAHTQRHGDDCESIHCRRRPPLQHEQASEVEVALRCALKAAQCMRSYA
jgi:hypothetical protein